ncbi:MAG TPA: DegT/DnrJ/EryC1/StrS aminotransferase family protein [Aeromicrobium sp.]|nr:DegT/DnrJ/EryC1/StrS aminotransferase family protein [Aeromicrobium sp.]HKY57463.1 DegT/DnrJ/EryC1/StrS aminotransferase family protein [Aeromicrobium sp.]
MSIKPAGSSGTIPYVAPSVTELEVEYATDAARNGWGEHCYDYIHRFEAEFRQHLGVDHAVATSSCTGAMELGLAGLGIGPGDEVILADTNWIATIAPIIHRGATPVLVDIRPDTWCIDPSLAAAAITPRTKAIVATHLYGNLCDMTELLDLGQRHGIAIIEDAAEAIGSSYGGRAAGSLGTFGVFSFHGTKTITTGEGGMFVTQDAALFETVDTLANHGRAKTQTKQFWPDMIGFKHKMSNIEAAIGCAQLERVDALVAAKRAVLNVYRAALEPTGLVTLNPELPNTHIGAWMSNAVYAESTGVTREQLVEVFRSHDVDARVFFYPLSDIPAVAAHLDRDVVSPVAHSIASRAINLPSAVTMTREQQDRVIEIALRVLDEIEHA